MGKKDIKALIDIAISTNNINIIREIIYIPFAIIKRTFQYHDHYIFQSFLSFTRFLYSSKKDATKLTTKDFLVDRSWKYLHEISSYHLMRQLGSSCKENDEDNIKSTTNFAKKIIYAFVDLLHAAFCDNSEDSTKDFNLFLKNINALFKKEEYNKYIKQISKELYNLKKQLLFCIGAWMLYTWNTSKSKYHKDMLKSLIGALPNDEIKLTDIFLKTYSSDFIEPYISEFYVIYDGEVHSIPTLESQQNFYLLLMLNNVSNKNTEVIRSFNLPYNQTILNLAGENGLLIGQLDTLYNHLPIYKDLISIEAVDEEKVSALKESLNKTAKKQQQENIKCVKEATINEEKRTNFVKYVLEGYSEPFSLKSIFRTKETENIELKNIKKKFGYKILIDKAMLVNCNPSIYFGLSAGGLGSNLVTSENLEIFKQIKKQCNALNLLNLKDYLDQNFHTEKDIIILTNSMFNLSYLAKKDCSFKQDWQIDEHESLPKNIIKNASVYYYYKWKDYFLPIYQINTCDKSCNIELLILHKKSLKCLTQNVFIDDNNLSSDKKFYIHFGDYSHDKEMLKNLLENKPDWLEKLGETKNQKEYLQQRILFEMYEHFSLDFSDNFVGGNITIEQK